VQNPRSLQEILVDGAGAVVVQLGVSDNGLVKFALEHVEFHSVRNLLLVFALYQVGRRISTRLSERGTILLGQGELAA